MRTSSLVVVGLTLSLVFGRNSVSNSEELEWAWGPYYVKQLDTFKASVAKVRLTEAQAIAIGRINTHLDSDADIDHILVPFRDVIKHLFGGRGILVVVDADALKKAHVTFERT